MNKPDYIYDINIDEKVISIVDLTQGNMSVTNGIEGVIKEIFAKEAISVQDGFKIIYRDSEGIWDGYDVKDNDFIHLGTTDQTTATNMIIKRDRPNPPEVEIEV